MKELMLIDDALKGVVDFVHQKLLTDWEVGGKIVRSEGFVRVYKERSFFPTTVTGWAFNLTLTALSLGSWLVVWALYAAATGASVKEELIVNAFPREEEGSRVLIQTNAESWGVVVHNWLTERYGAAPVAAEGG